MARCVVAVMSDEGKFTIVEHGVEKNLNTENVTKTIETKIVKRKFTDYYNMEKNNKVISEKIEESTHRGMEKESFVEKEAVKFVKESIELDRTMAAGQISWPGQKDQPTQAPLPPIISGAHEIFQEVFREDRVEMYKHLANRAGNLAKIKFAEARGVMEEAAEDGFHASIETLMARVAGARQCSIARIQVFNSGGVLLSGVDLGSIRIRKILIRVSSIPVLAAAVQTWKATSSSRGPPLLLDKLHLAGMRVRSVNARELAGAVSAFRGFPGGISVTHMIISQSSLGFAPTGRDHSFSALPEVPLTRVELREVWNKMDLVTMVSCLTRLQEPEHPHVPDPCLALLDAGAGSDGRRARGSKVRDGNIDVKVEGEWRNEWRRDQARGWYEGVASLVDKMPVEPPAALKGKTGLPGWEAVERLGGAVLEQGPSLVRAAAQRRGFGPDLQTLYRLTRQGVPMRMLEDQGENLLRMIETGVAAAILERGDLVRSLVSRGLLEPLIREGVLDVALERPELVVDLAGQGCLDGLVNSGVLEAMMRAKNLNVLKDLLRGNLIEGLTYSGVLADCVSNR
eukprot:CAMPEP_0196598114 /NCGR_PEP_ID=MMETSP1081-20130531/94133_1 /TAXON_ID=36882 /ORGANISM="Pyramimonas amylifera, Strain CCMP720" /LENGTH=568 /DNA_ID=CAMNT_0041923761 /DNA_START=205 /DNA_END=1911 /DNA_ORIENTATION=-